MTLHEALARTCCTLDTISDDTDPKQGVKAFEMQGTDDQEAESFWQMANVTMWLEDKCIHAHHQVCVEALTRDCSALPPTITAKG
jgi:hypothetical protein